MGYPIGSDTYDGVWIGYNHGLPITGLEFEDFHITTSYAPSNSLTNNAYPYLEPVWPTGGTVSAESMSKQKKVNERYTEFANGFNLEYNDITLMDGEESGAAASVASTNGNESDPRKGKMTSPLPKGHVYGAAVGMSVHTAAGIWCGVDDLTCATGLPGLYAAGDGTNGCYVGGPCYGAQRGSTSSFMSVQGFHAGTYAAQCRRRRRRRDASASRGGSAQGKGTAAHHIGARLPSRMDQGSAALYHGSGNGRTGEVRPKRPTRR